MTEKKTIIISPIGDIPAWISELIAKKVKLFFGFSTRVESVINSIEFAYDQNRNQYYSTEILKHLEDNAPNDALKVLAVTNEDLFIPILTHVYGEAQLDGTASIISLNRLIQGLGVEIIEKGSARIVKEAVHELGHCFNLRHCDDPMCLMHYCRKIDDVDHKVSQFCRYCDIILTDTIKVMSN